MQKCWLSFSLKHNSVLAGCLNSTSWVWWIRVTGEFEWDYSSYIFPILNACQLNICSSCCCWFFFFFLVVVLFFKLLCIQECKVLRQSSKHCISLHVALSVSMQCCSYFRQWLQSVFNHCMWLPEIVLILWYFLISF